MSALLLAAALAAAATGHVSEIRSSEPARVLGSVSGDSSEGASFLRAEALLRAGRLPEALASGQAFQNAFPGSVLSARARLLEAWTLLEQGEHLRGVQILSEIAAAADAGAAAQAVGSLRQWARSGHLPASVLLQIPFLWPGIDDSTLEVAGRALPERPLVAILPLTGPFAQIGRRVARGAELSAAEVGSGLVVLDEPSDPIQAALLVRGILRVARPRAVVGPLLSNTATTVALEMARTASDIPLILPAATSPGVSALDPAAWQINITTHAQGASAAGLVRDCLGSAEAYLLWPKTEFGESVAEGFRRELPRRGGHVVWQRSFQAGGTDFRALLESLRRTAQDLARRRGKDTSGLAPVVFVPSESPSEALALASQASQLGLKARWIGASGWHSRQFLVETSGRMEGAYLVTDNIPDESRPAWRKFSRRWSASESDAPDRLAALGWDAVQVALLPSIPSRFAGAQSDLRLDPRTRANLAVGELRVEKGAFAPANCPAP